MLHTTPRAAVAIPLPRRLPKDLRPAIEAAAQRHMEAFEGLAALLDLFDGEPDLEPSLAARMGYGGGIDDQTQWARSPVADLEDEHDGAEPPCEDEGAQCEDEGAQCDDEGAQEGP